MLGQVIADQDDVCLHRQDARLSRLANGDWSQFYLATPSDVGVSAYRRWFHGMAGASRPFTLTLGLVLYSYNAAIVNALPKHSCVAARHSAAGACSLLCGKVL